MVLMYEALDGRGGHAAGRALLEKMYVAQTGKPMPNILIQSRGKPCFENDPLHFSISHSKSHVFCVLSRNPIGIDAERMDRDIDLGLAEKILSPTEYAQWEQANDRRLALLKFWVLKEAAAKQTGEGLRGYPNTTDFSLDDPRLQFIENHIIAVIE